MPVKQKKGFSIACFVISLYTLFFSFLTLFIPVVYIVVCVLMILSLIFGCIACFKDYALKGLYIAGILISGFSGMSGLFFLFIRLCYGR